MKGSTAKRAKRSKINKRTRKVKRGGFRYGKTKAHTPTPGEILISEPSISMKSRTRTRTKSRSRKHYSWF